tara:strand:- start:336 stop:893 length:558 start_codon:yes stop_codon:yes gene_type:complete
MPDYYLVNPVIGGSLKTKFSGKNNLDAANEAYISLSKYFNNNIPEFYFTLQEITSDKTQIGGGKITDYKNFLVKETKKKNEVSYRLVEYKVNNKNELKKFRAELKKLNNKFQLGGHKYDDLDDDILEDDSDSSEIYFPKVKRSTILSNPISFWFYDPYVFRIKKYYMPTYVAPLAPYISIPLYLS